MFRRQPISIGQCDIQHHTTAPTTPHTPSKVKQEGPDQLTPNAPKIINLRYTDSNKNQCASQSSSEEGVIISH